MLHHEVRGVYSLFAMLDHPLHIVFRGNDLGPYSMIVIPIRLLIHEGAVIGGHSEGNLMFLGQVNGLSLIICEFDESTKRGLLAYDMLEMPSPIAPLVGSRTKNLHHSTLIILTASNDVMI